MSHCGLCMGIGKGLCTEPKGRVSARSVSGSGGRAAGSGQRAARVGQDGARSFDHRARTLRGALLTASSVATLRCERAKRSCFADGHTACRALRRAKQLPSGAMTRRDMAARQGGSAVQGVSDDERWGCPEGQAHDEDMSAGLNLGAACESRCVVGWPAGSAGQTRDAAGALEGSVERETALAVPATLCANGRGG
jgi:hypothetical protein